MDTGGDEEANWKREAGDLYRLLIRQADANNSAGCGNRYERVVCEQFSIPFLLQN